METKQSDETLESNVAQLSGPYCEPCKELNKQNPSTLYCKECDEYLCEECRQNHKTIKATKQHEPIPVSEKVKEHTKQCEPCESKNVSETAVSFCDECDEYLCAECTNNHKLSKATKSHVPVRVELKFNSTSQSDELRQLCEPCTADKKSQTAVRFCEICEELLCEKCTDRHKISKATKSHVPVPVEFIKLTKITSSATDICDICKGFEKESPATQYCVECDEILCDRCVETHRIQKITKTHKIKTLAERKKSVQACDICQDESNIAFKFCMDCEELLCEKCTQQHTKQKATRTHVLGPVPEKQDEQCIMCSPCSASDESIKSIHYCKECNEFLCITCSDRHRRQKFTKMHDLCKTEVALKEFPKCQLCLAEGKNNLAVTYCKDCEENMCEGCTEIHAKQKATKNHKRISVKDHLENEPEHRVEIDAKKDSSIIQQTDNAAKDRPGKPYTSTTDIKADSIVLYWDQPDIFNEGDSYQVSYRDVDSKGKWKIWTEECNRATTEITNMKSNTKFAFRVRVVFSHGDEGPYSEESDEYCTINSPASRIVSFAKRLDNKDETSPIKYGLPITELRNARNEKAKTKKFEIGTPPTVVNKERTIMLVGATGTGKSTLVDGLVNYVLGVNWIDSFRFSVIDLEEEEKDRIKNQAQSQTEWITCYTINPEHGSRLNYRLNIIDTPGFGDTRGLTRDQEIVEQIRQLFSDTGPKGISCIDAVCFLIKAPDARLTAVQTYIFQSVMSLFGKDIEHNICSLITFADGIDPPVLAALKESQLPFGQYFTFNSSGLFAKNTDISTSSLSPMFWDMGLSSFRAFFNHLETVQTRSLQLTKDVLDERFRLEATVRNLQPHIDVGLTKVDQLKKELKILDDNKALIKDNANFEYEVPETQQRKKELPKGVHVTNCTNCHFTCHDHCGFADDKDKARCCAMNSDGNCKVCPDKCHWSKHANTPYIFEYVDVKVKKTYAEMQKKYQEATGKLLSQEQILEQMTIEIDDICEDIEDMMEIVRNCNDKIKEMALRPNPLSMTEHIDMMIEAEKLDKKPGFQNRIRVLNDFRKRARVLTDAENFSKEARSTLVTVGKGERKRGVKRDIKDLFNRFRAWIGAA